MSLFKRKTIKKFTEIGINLAILSGFLWHTLNPLMVLAQKEQELALLSKETTLSSTPADRMFYPQTSIIVPDKRVLAVITAYTSTVDQCDDDPFIAASGKHVYDGMIAANWLPFGTKIKIPSLYGDKIFTVDDRMNARYGYGRMDVWLDTSRTEARKFGVKRVEIEVYYPEQKIAKK